MQVDYILLIIFSIFGLRAQIGLEIYILQRLIINHSLDTFLVKDLSFLKNLNFSSDKSKGRYKYQFMTEYYAWYSATQETIRRNQKVYSYPSKRNQTTLTDIDRQFILPSLERQTPGCIYWQDNKGVKYEVTMVTRTPEHGCNEKHLKDLQYLGKVTSYAGICRW
jgi:hypothetical protein